MAEDITNSDQASTPYCRNFQRNACQRRDSCKYLHKKEEPPPPSQPSDRPQFCKYYQGGGCFRSNCKFLHCTEQEYHSSRPPKDYFRGKNFRENYKFQPKEDSEAAGHFDNLAPAPFDGSSEQQAPFPPQPSFPAANYPARPDDPLQIELQRLKYQNDFIIQENEELRKKNSELKKNYEYMERKYEELRKNEEQRTLRAYSFCNSYSTHIAPELMNNSTPLSKYPLVSYPLKSISGRDSDTPYHRPN